MSKVQKIKLARPYYPRAALTPQNLEFWVGREPQISRVVRGLLASINTHYLITGYAGVGKTSFVSRIITEWQRLSVQQGIERVLIFNLQFVESQLTEEVVRRIAGKVYFASIDGFFKPNKQIQERLRLNFIRSVSKNLKESQTENKAGENGGEASITLPMPKPLNNIGLKFFKKTTNENSRTLEFQQEYNVNAAINDLESVLHLLTKPESYGRKWFWKNFWRRKKIQTRILFIFDQIDDLTSIQNLSQLFLLPGASFLVLGGMKLRQEMSDAHEAGIHVLDSFQEEYLPCLWDEADKILYN